MKNEMAVVLVLVLIGAGLVYTSYHPVDLIKLPSKGPPGMTTSTFTTTSSLTSSSTTSSSAITSSSTFSVSSTSETTSSITTTSSTSSSTSSSFTSGSSVIWIGADAGALANTGIYSVIDVQNQNFGGCLSFWVGEESFASGLWGQVGYFVCQSGAPEAFAQIWDLNSGRILQGFSSSVSTGQGNFSMYQTTGTTWSFAVNSNVMGSFDMGSAAFGSQEPIFAMSEQNEVASANPFSTVTFVSALNLKTASGWQPVSSASAYIQGSGWKIAGDVQNSDFPANQFAVGTQLPYTAVPGQALW